jgi:hypothetical protein
MRAPGGKKTYRLLREVLNTPLKLPPAKFDFTIPIKLLDRDLWLIVTHGCHANKDLGL